MHPRRVHLHRAGIAGVFALLMASQAALAQPTPIGAEIDVFDGSSDYAYYPRVAMDPAGNFVVAWRDTNLYETTRARGFWSNGNPRGPIFEANPPGIETDFSGDVTELVAIAADDAGNFVIAYNGYGPTLPGCDVHSCLLTKRYDADGKVSASNFIVGDPRQNVYPPSTFNPVGNPELAADGEGNFVVAWEGYDINADGSNGVEGVRARRLVAVGQVNGAAFRVNEHTDGYQGDAGYLDVAADGEGNFVLVWEDDNYVLPPYGGIVFRRFDKAKNPIGAQTQVEPSGGYDPHVVQHPDGNFLVTWQDNGAVEARVYDEDGVSLGPAFEVTASGDYSEAAVSTSGEFVVVYTDGDDSSGKVFDSTGTQVGSEFTIVDAWKPDVGADAAGNFVVAYGRYGYNYAQRFQTAPPTPQEILVTGKVAALTNKIPDNFEKSGGKWKASGAEIVSPLRGSASDPRCNGDPEGTVKASVRFVSATSAQDHTFPLPCENWSTTGGNKVKSVLKRGYKYSDPKREDGPCNSIKIKGTKSISVSCKGRPGAAAFPFDLVAAQSQDVLATALETGLIKHCAEFQPLFDGSDGKKYKGKGLGAPAACP